MPKQLIKILTLSLFVFLLGAFVAYNSGWFSEANEVSKLNASFTTLLVENPIDSLTLEKTDSSNFPDSSQQKMLFGSSKFLRPKAFEIILEETTIKSPDSIAPLDSVLRKMRFGSSKSLSPSTFDIDLEPKLKSDKLDGEQMNQGNP